jgi:hypothetical protein
MIGKCLDNDSISVEQKSTEEKRPLEPGSRSILELCHIMIRGFSTVVLIHFCVYLCWHTSLLCCSSMPNLLS